MKKALCLLMASSLYIGAISENKLSVSEAIEVISFMNAKDVHELDHLLISHAHALSNSAVSNIVNGIVKVTKRYNYERLYGRNLVARVLEAYESATKPEQEAIEKAIADSVQEYSFAKTISFPKVLASLVLFPVGIPWLIYKEREHAQKIEAQRERQLQCLKNTSFYELFYA
jgi:hypothetical protein